jgi:hypothetical protein
MSKHFKLYNPRLDGFRFHPHLQMRHPNGIDTSVIHRLILILIHLFPSYLSGYSIIEWVYLFCLFGRFMELEQINTGLETRHHPWCFGIHSSSSSSPISSHHTPFGELMNPLFCFAEQLITLDAIYGRMSGGGHAAHGHGHGHAHANHSGHANASAAHPPAAREADSHATSSTSSKH